MVSVGFSADVQEALLLFVAAVSAIGLVTIVVRNARARPLVRTAVVASTLSGLAWISAWNWNEMVFQLVFLLELSFLGVLSALVLQRVLLPGHRIAAGLCGAANSGIVVPLLLQGASALFYGGSILYRERGAWVLWVPFVAPVGALFVAWLFVLGRAVFRGVGTMDHADRPRAEATGVSADERALVMSMLEQGKVSGTEATQLLGAVRGSGRRGDELPISGGEFAAIAGAVLIAVGFVVPWAFIRIPLPANSLFGALAGSSHRGAAGFQAGYHLKMGWLLLGIGVLPALFACVPALDRVLRQGLLRFVLASLGGALTIALCLHNPKNIGIWLCCAGFGIQLISALAQAGILSVLPFGPPPPVKHGAEPAES